MRKLPVARVQGVLTRVARELGGIAERLEGIRSRIPDSAKERRGDEECPPDLVTVLAATVECVLVDCLRPAQRALEEAASLKGLELPRS